MTVARARKIQKFLSQPFFMSEVFTGRKGKFVELKDTIEGFSCKKWFNYSIIGRKGRRLPRSSILHAGNIVISVRGGKKDGDASI